MLSALGTDTGGSTRLPAAYCGVYGFKPSYGLLSRHGVISYASSLDTVGILSKDVDIVERVFSIIVTKGVTLDVLNKFDPLDSTSLSEEKRSQLKQHLPRDVNWNNLTIGIPIEYFPEEVAEDDEVVSQFDQVVKGFESKGATVKLISVPHVKYALPAYYIIASAEASSNLAKYDGLRYGYSADNSGTESERLLNTRTKGFGEEVSKRVIL